MKHRKLRIACVAAGGGAALLITLWLVAAYIAAYMVTHPQKTAIHEREELGGKPVETVAIQTEDGITLEAWYVPNSPDRAVILLAGIGAERRQTVRQGKLYVELGYTVLMPDLRASGNSGGDVVSIGWHERKDLAACYRFLREKGYEHIGADGISMGAATICFSLQDIDDWAFIVLESAYDTIEHATEHRLDKYNIPHFLALPVTFFAEMWLGVGADVIRPIDYMPMCNVPALIMGGDSEGILLLSETQALYDQCASPLKRLVVYEGGEHHNFLKYFPEQYRQELTKFLAEVEAAWPEKAKSAKEAA